MENAFILKGRIEDSKYIILSEIFTHLKGEVEIIIRPLESKKKIQNFFSFINSLPVGTRSKDSIDKQIQQERSLWD